MQHELQVSPDPAAVAAQAAGYVAARARAAVSEHGRFTFAVSGGHTPWAMFAELAKQDVPWADIELFQVDERVAPDGDPDRNLTHLRESIGDAPARVRAMPVNDPDLDKAAAQYAAVLPQRFDLVHLGLGPDGHTASLVPGDPALTVTDKLVAVTQPYQGHPRMTLTYPALARADQLLWLVTGSDKRAPLAKLLAGDESIPAGRVQAARSLVLADSSADPRGDPHPRGGSAPRAPPEERRPTPLTPEKPNPPTCGGFAPTRGRHDSRKYRQERHHHY